MRRAGRALALQLVGVFLAVLFQQAKAALRLRIDVEGEHPDIAAVSFVGFLLFVRDPARRRADVAGSRADSSLDAVGTST